MNAVIHWHKGCAAWENEGGPEWRYQRHPALDPPSAVDYRKGDPW